MDHPSPADDNTLMSLEGDPAGTQDPPGGPSAQGDGDPGDAPSPPVPAVPHPPEPTVPLSALLAERRKADESASALQQRLAEMHAQLAALHAPPAASGVSDPEAVEYARDMELFDAQTGQPDIPRAKRIIQRNREDARRLAETAAQQYIDSAVTPQLAQTAQQTDKVYSDQNFIWAATQRDADGAPLPEPIVRQLATVWAELPHNMTRHREVAQTVLEKVLGQSILTQKRRTAPPSREPVVTEPPGGRPAAAYTATNLERRIAQEQGIPLADMEKIGKTYQPGRMNTLE